MVALCGSPYLCSVRLPPPCDSPLRARSPPAASAASLPDPTRRNPARTPRPAPIPSANPSAVDGFGRCAATSTASTRRDRRCRRARRGSTRRVPPRLAPGDPGLRRGPAEAPAQRRSNEVRWRAAHHRDIRGHRAVHSGNSCSASKSCAPSAPVGLLSLRGADREHRDKRSRQARSFDSSRRSRHGHRNRKMV